MHRCSPFPTSSPRLVSSSLFDSGYSNKFEVISHCGFDLHFPDKYLCWASFHVSVGPLYIFYGKTCVQMFCSLGHFVIDCMSSFFILDVSPLPDGWFAIMFFHLVGCRFFFWWLPLLCRSFLVWCHPICLFLLLLLLVLVSDSKSNHQALCQGAYRLCFLLGISYFQVLRSSVEPMLSSFFCMV